MTLKLNWLTLILVGFWIAEAPRPGSASPGTRGVSAHSVVDTLELFLGEPDSAIGYDFDYEFDAGAERPDIIRRSPCFVNFPARQRFVLTRDELSSLQSIIREARGKTVDFDSQFFACCGLPSWGFVLYRGGRAGCLQLYLCSCRTGWSFSRRGYEVGGMCTKLVSRFEAFEARLRERQQGEER
jgi:hypothetical protein